LGKLGVAGGVLLDGRQFAGPDAGGELLRELAQQQGGIEHGASPDERTLSRELPTRKRGDNFQRLKWVPLSSPTTAIRHDTCPNRPNCANRPSRWALASAAAVLAPVTLSSSVKTLPPSSTPSIVGPQRSQRGPTSVSPSWTGRPESHGHRCGRGFAEN